MFGLILEETRSYEIHISYEGSCYASGAAKKNAQGSGPIQSNPILSFSFSFDETSERASARARARVFLIKYGAFCAAGVTCQSLASALQQPDSAQT
jgi:hypothetical protein